MTIESENITSFRNTVKELCTIPPPSTISSNSNAKRRKRGKGGGGTIGNSTIHTNHTFQTQRTPHTQYSQRTNNTKGGGGGNNNGGGVNDMNARAIRIAAITRALVETIDERLGTTTSNKMGEDDSDDNDDNSDDDDKDDGSAVAPAPLFLAVLEALSDTLPKLPTSTSTSTSSTSPKKRDKETMDDDNHTNEGKMAPHVIPLLEILRQIIPHVTQSNPNIVLTHFKSLSNTIRAICAIMVPVSTSGLDRDGGGGSGGKSGNNNSGGSNALTRIILNVSTLIIQNMFQLLQLETSNNTMYDKDILRFFHVTILNYWEDGRPKIRKEAHSCVLELLLLVVTSGKNISKVPTMLAPHMIRYCTKILQNAFMFHEKDVVVSSNNNNNNNNNNKRKNIVRKTMHVLSFLEQASSTIQIMMNNTTTSTTSGKNKESVNGLVLILTKLTITAVSLSSSSSSSATSNNMDAIMGISNNGNNMNNNGITIANMMDGFTMAGGALLALNRIFSFSKGDNYQDELATATTTTTNNNNEQFQSLGMQTLATLLQNNASLLASATALANLAKKKKKGDSNTDDAVAAIQDGYTSCGGSTLLLYSRCIVTLVSCTTTTTSTTTTSNPVITTIGKLIPECFSSIIRCLTIDSMVLNTDGASGICTEIQGLLQVLQMFLSTSNTDTEKKEWCQSIVMSCIPPFSKVLHPTYRPRWEYVLSCMASFVVYAAATTTTTNNNDDNDDDDENDNSTQITNTLSSFPPPLKDLVEALVDLHRSTTTSTSSSSTKDRKRRRNNNNNTSSGNNSPTAVTTMVEASSIERSIGTIASGLGLELFLNIIDLSLPCNGGVGNSMDSGAVCDERSWLLPILTSSNMNAATPVVTTMFSSSLDCSQPQLSPPPRLSFFKNVILDLARKCDAAAAKTTTTMAAAVTKQRSSILQSRVYDLWSLFPCFCIRVTNKDLQDMFPNLVVTLVKAMGDVRYPKLVPIICNGLKIIADNAISEKKVEDELLENTMSNNDNDNDDNDNEKNSQVTISSSSSSHILSNVCTKLLPALFRLVESLHGTATAKTTKKKLENDEGMEGGIEDNGEQDSTVNVDELQQRSTATTSLNDAIAAFAPLCSKEFLDGLFRKIMQRLLKCTMIMQSSTRSKEEEKKDGDTTEKIYTLLGLAQALIRSEALGEESVTLLYRAIRPLIRSDEFNARVQKRSYSVMVEICQKYVSFVNAPERLEEMTELMVGSIVTMQVPARLGRLKCMKLMVEAFDTNNSQHMDVIPKIMGEVLLSLKDSNGKTREAGYRLLLSMAEVKDNMNEYFSVILAALGGQTSHMRSAAVMALSRLVFEYVRVDAVVRSLLPSLLQTVTVMFDEKSREVIKSVIGFVRVSIAAMEKEELEPLLPEVVGGIMKYGKGKGRFRSKIKIILKKLVKAYSYQVIMPLVPEDDTRLLNHMRKISEREARQKVEQQLEDGGGEYEDQFDELMDSDEEDSDGGRTLMTGVTGFTRMTGTNGKIQKTQAILKSKKGKSVASIGQSIRSTKSTGPRINMKTENNGGVLDMLDPAISKSLQVVNEDDHDSDFSDDDGGAMEFNEDGKLIINDIEKIKSNEDDHEEDDAEDRKENEQILAGGKRRRVSKFDNVKDLRKEDNLKQRQKHQKEENQSLGGAYKSKKAGGDVTKKGQKYQPYAYVPLDAKNYTKKNRGKSVAQMSSVVREKGGKRRKR